MAIPSSRHLTVNQPDGTVGLATRTETAPASGATTSGSTTTRAPSLRSRGNAALAGLQDRIAQRLPARATVLRGVGNAMTVGGGGLAVHGVASALGMAPALVHPVTDGMTRDEAYGETLETGLLVGMGEFVLGATISMFGSVIAAHSGELAANAVTVPDSPTGSDASEFSVSPAGTPRRQEIEMLEITHQPPAATLPGDEMV